jgi:hypothetical protein
MLSVCCVGSAGCMGDLRLGGDVGRRLRDPDGRGEARFEAYGCCGVRGGLTRRASWPAECSGVEEEEDESSSGSESGSEDGDAEEDGSGEEEGGDGARERPGAKRKRREWGQGQPRLSPGARHAAVKAAREAR